MADPRETVAVRASGALRDLAGRLAGHDAASLIDPLRADQAARWRAGAGLLAEDYLAAFPALRGRTEDLLVLIWGEVMLRAERGAAPDAAEYQRRFPDHAEALAVQFELERGLATTMIGTPPAPAPRPAAPIGFAQVGRRGPQPGEEVQVLLRKRLRVVALIAFGVPFFFFALRFWRYPLDTRTIWVEFVPGAGWLAL